MNASDLTSQLTALSESLQKTKQLTIRLSKLKFQPGSEPLEGDGGVRVELAQDIHDSLKQLEEEFEFLRQEVEDYKEHSGQRRRGDSRAGQEARISAKVARLAEELVHSRQQFRNAQIAAKFASEEAKRQEREALLAGYRREAEQLEQQSEATPNGTARSATEQLFARRSKHQQQKQLTKDQVLVNASSDVTAALRRTHDLLSSELSRSRFAQETFDESTAALNQLGEDYSSLGDILSNSRNLLGTLLRSQKSDTWYLETAFKILVATVFWLIFRRLLYGPFFRLPIFLWNVFAFFTNWIFLKPLFFILSLIGVITTEPANSASSISADISSSTRAPLIVQPSASGRGPPLPPRPKKGENRGVPAGAGGAQAKVGKDALEGGLSQKIAEMAEESAKAAERPVQQEEQKEEKEPVRRGDGTILQERGDVPPNPRKKQFEADVEDAKEEEKARVKRDEL